MRRTLIFITMIVMILSTVLTAPVSYGEEISKNTDWFDHNDRKNIYEISTEAELIGLCSLVNEEQTDIWKPTRVENFEEVTIKLTEDIELTQPWTPIGIDESACFFGVFDGNGHTIKGLNIISSYGASGLFGYLPGEVKNLNIRGSISSYDSNSGSIAGILTGSGSVINCNSSVNIKGLDKCGGVIGNNEGGSIKGCVNSGDISGTYKVGGIAGENHGGIISECTNNGKIKSTRRGVVTYGTGGIAGRSVSYDAEITDCVNNGEIHSNTEATGGIAGYVNSIGSTIDNCSNTGNISINIKSSDKELATTFVGGIAGIIGSKGVNIINCKNIGIINNPDITGGIIGRYRNTNEGIPSERYIRNNYYIYRTFSSGIGFTDDSEDNNIDKAAIGVSTVKMNNMMAPDRSFYGQVILDILSPRKMIKNVSDQYAEAKDKIEELKEKESENHDQQQDKQTTHGKIRYIRKGTFTDR